MWQINLLQPKFTSIRADLAETVAKSVAEEKFNMIITRPAEIINFLSKSHPNSSLLKTPEFLFLKKYRKTMDFFAIWPKQHPKFTTAKPSDIIEYFFAHAGLVKYTRPIIHQGFALEVKSFLLRKDSQFFDDSLLLSENQQKMINDLKKIPHLDLIFAKVGFWGNYNMTIKFLSIKRKVLTPNDFALINNSFKNISPKNEDK